MISDEMMITKIICICILLSNIFLFQFKSYRYYEIHDLCYLIYFVIKNNCMVNLKYEILPFITRINCMYNFVELNEFDMTFIAKMSSFKLIIN